MAVGRGTQFFRVSAAAVFASIPAFSYKVFAAGDPSDDRRKVKITELPLYENQAEKVEIRYEEEEISTLRKCVSEVRQKIWTYLDSVKETTDKVKNKYEVSKSHTQGLIDYVKNDRGLLPRAVIITVSGLGGVVAGNRGGAPRKVLYSVSAMVAATALCYPNESLAIMVSFYRSLWTTKEPCVNKECPNPASKPNSPVKQAPKSTLENQSFIIGGDPGQSREEDKDLYTTRSD